MIAIDRQPWPLRRGVTLLELLVVCVVALLISGAVLRQVVPSLASRQLREGARMVNVFMNAARNRAVTTGRPAGFWLDRLSTINEACVSLAYAQVPDPYSGDYSDSMLESFLVAIPSQQDPNLLGNPGPQFVANVVVASSIGNPKQQLNPSRPETWSFPSMQKFVRVGDQIRVNLQSKPYRLFTIPELPNAWVIAVGVNQSYLFSGKYRVAPGNGPFNQYLSSGHRYGLNFFNDLGMQVTPYITPGSTVNKFGTPVPYQILRQPQRMAAGSMQLPESVCIDLNFSGTVDNTIGGISGNWCYLGMRPFHPRYDPADNTIPPSPYRGTAYDPTDMSPIIVMFNPSGSVEQVYCRYWIYNGTGPGSPWVWRGDSLLSPLHFLIGHMSNLPFSGSTSPTVLLTTNLADTTNIWCTVHPFTGLITTTEVRALPAPGSNGTPYTVNPDLRLPGTSGYTAGLLWYSVSGAQSGGDLMGGR